MLNLDLLDMIDIDVEIPDVRSSDAPYGLLNID